MDAGSRRPKNDGKTWKIIRKEQIRKVLKSIEIEAVPASDDISSSPSVYKMTITTAISDGSVSDSIRAKTNEASEKPSTSTWSPSSDAHEYGHDELKPDM